MVDKSITVLIVIIAVAVLGFSVMRLFEEPSLLKAGDIVVEVVAEGLVVPWAMDFLPDGRMIFTERVGRISVVDDGVVVVAEVDVAAVGEGGLLGIAVDPEFDVNGFVYAYYTYSDGGVLFNRVVRFRMVGLGLVEETVILDKITGASIHNGGRLKFGSDGRLYVATGDASDSMLAQDVDSLAGKILRINKDGSVPGDNPFGNLVFSLGHRNPQGLAWHPVSGDLFSTEHGAVRNDEVNVVVAGGNYGWPLVECSGGEGYVDPVVCFGDVTVAPSGATFYSGDRLPWRYSLFFGSLRGEHLHRVVFGEDYGSVLEEEVLLGEYGRIRDVVEHDGFLYVATSNRDGRGTARTGDDKIIRIIGVSQ